MIMTFGFRLSIFIGEQLRVNRKKDIKPIVNKEFFISKNLFIKIQIEFHLEVLKTSIIMKIILSFLFFFNGFMLYNFRYFYSKIV